MINFVDQLFLVAHDEYTGRARAHEETLGFALAAGLLVELLFPPEQIQLVDSTVLLVSQHALPNEPLQHRVVNLIRGERPPQRAGTWIKVLAADARDRIAGRLADAGQVTPRSKRRIFGDPVAVYPAQSAEQAAYETTRLHGALHRYRVYTVDLMLAALVDCVGLLGHVTYGCESPHPSGAQLATALPPLLQTILDHTRAAIAESTMSPR